MRAIPAATACSATHQAPEMSWKPVRAIRMDGMESIHRKTGRMIFTARLTKSE